MKKKVFALLLCAAMSVSLIAGCGNKANDKNAVASDKVGETATDEKETDEKATDKSAAGKSATEESATEKPEQTNPIEDIVNSYYSYYYDVSADLRMDYFFHFYDEMPGIGNVFYAGFCINQITFTGTYEVKEEEIEYACWPDRAALEKAGEGAAPPTGTAPYTIYFYDMDGKELDKCGFDGTKLYMDMEAITGVGGENSVYNLDADPENSVIADSYAGETAMTLKSFISPDDETATLELLVNGKYKDMVVVAADGTFEANDNKTKITLKSSDGSADATVTANEDGTYTYKAADGTEVVLAEAGAASAVTYSFVGQVPVPGMEDTMGDLKCDFNDDGTVRVYAAAMGQEFDLDSGTYKVDMETYTITTAFEKAGELVTYATEAGMNLDYAQKGAEVFGDIAVTVTMAAK